MLEVRELRKRYGNVTALDGVSLRADRGETIGLLGPNGAGKTTTVSIIAGLLRGDAGEVLIEGRPLRCDTDPIKQKIGLVPQDIALYDELPARDNLNFFAALYNLDCGKARPAVEAALELVGLADRARDKRSPCCFSTRRCSGHWRSSVSAGKLSERRCARAPRAGGNG